MLVKQGYIVKKQHSYNNGKFSSNIYKLLGYAENINVIESELTELEVSEEIQKDLQERDEKNKKFKQAKISENKFKRDISSFENLLKTNINFNEDVIDDDFNSFKVDVVIAI